MPLFITQCGCHDRAVAHRFHGDLAMRTLLRVQHGETAGHAHRRLQGGITNAPLPGLQALGKPPTALLPRRERDVARLVALQQQAQVISAGIINPDPFDFPLALKHGDGYGAANQFAVRIQHLSGEDGAPRR